MAFAWEDGICLGGWHMLGRMAYAWEDGICLGGWHLLGRMAFAWEDGICLGGWHLLGRMAFAWEDGICLEGCICLGRCICLQTSWLVGWLSFTLTSPFGDMQATTTMAKQFGLHYTESIA